MSVRNLEKLIVIEYERGSRKKGEFRFDNVDDVNLFKNEEYAEAYCNGYGYKNGYCAATLEEYLDCMGINLDGINHFLQNIMSDFNENEQVYLEDYLNEYKISSEEFVKNNK